MKKYQELEQKIKELQAEVDRLKAQEKENKLPENFGRDVILKFLSDPNTNGLYCGFSWKSTPQGIHYWHKISDSLCILKSSYKVPDEAIIQLQKWVILSYQQQYGN